jgi:lipopolysaccharide export LptBFGC system permease protein LptF
VQYLDQRLLFYTTRDPRELEQINSETAKLQNTIWSIVQNAGLAQPNSVAALVVSGMNDVSNRQGYTQAAWWNRIPPGAWILMMALAICCSFLIGYGKRRLATALFTVFPVIVSVAFFLIADIDSPRRGFIPLRPQNLISLAQSLHSN